MDHTRLGNFQILLFDIFWYRNISKIKHSIITDVAEPKIGDKEIISLQSASTAPSIFRDAVVVIGYAVRFPRVDNISQFWNILNQSKETIVFYTKEELRQAGVKEDLINNSNYVRASNRLDNIEYFDANFFGYTSKEAQIMDPQIRLFHEIAQEALETAGYNPKIYQGNIGVYAGAARNYQWEDLLKSFNQFSASQFSIQRQLHDSNYCAARLAFNLGLRGPSYFINTACSTSLVAIHLAARAILTGECDMALAGGASINNQDYLY